MAKRKPSRNARTSPTVSGPGRGTSEREHKAGLAAQMAAAVDARLLAAATAENLPVPEWSESGPEQSLRHAFEVLESRRKVYEACSASAANRLRAVELREQEVVDAQQALEADRRAVTDAAEATERDRRGHASATAALQVREEQVHASETEARSGFRAMAESAAAELFEELAERREVFEAELNTEQERAAKRIEELERDAQLRQSATLADIDAARERIRLRDNELDEREQRLRHERAALRTRGWELDEREQAIAGETAAALSARTAETERIQHIAQVEVESARIHITDLTERLRQAQTALTAIGSDPRVVLDELARLRAENTELRDKLAERLTDDNLGKLRLLERTLKEVSAERERLAYECQRLKGDALANQINLLGVRQLEDAEHQFQVVSRGYEARIAELRSTIEELYSDRPDPGTPLFPRCVAMDDTPELDEPGILEDQSSVDLAALSLSLQSTMFHRSGRAYRVNDIAVFLGGMAMSRLHLLEGMSGIGKTSLPRAFAAALHTDCTVVEVQAGWRDRADLFGHLDTFQKRFEESDFLQALYRAQTPHFRGRPYFIVLDEMNLSRPEQYFSVILSKLENDDGRPINLVGASAGRKPALLTDGIGIRLPRNVWFIGTANQDESTLEFADKTYNRAHLMELSAHRPRIDSQRRNVDPISLHSLEAAFERAKKENGPAARSVLDLVTNLSDDFWELGRLQMSPRVENQLRAFVPVVAAAVVAGGDAEHHNYGDSTQNGPSLAADHFLAYKILRPIRGRYDVTSDNIERLREALTLHWNDSGLAGEPVRCLRILDDERRRRDG